jgi:hypothetical protein
MERQQLIYTGTFSCHALNSICWCRLDHPVEIDSHLRVDWVWA